MLYPLLGGGLVLAALLALIAASSRHKKSATGDIELVGRRGRVEAALTPEGAVIIDGEMWRAVTRDESHVAQNRVVKVCGARAHLLVVEEVDG